MFLTILSFGCKLLGLTTWAEQLYQSYKDKQAGIAIQVAKDNSNTLEEVEKINAIEAQVQGKSHAELVADYAKLHASINGKSS